MSESIKERLINIATNKNLWNKYINIDNEKYIFVSSRNEFRKNIKQSSGEINILVGLWINNKFIEV